MTNHFNVGHNQGSQLGAGRGCGVGRRHGVGLSLGVTLITPVIQRTKRQIQFPSVNPSSQQGEKWRCVNCQRKIGNGDRAILLISVLIPQNFPTAQARRIRSFLKQSFST